MMLSICASTSWGSDRDCIIKLSFDKMKVFVMITDTIWVCTSSAF